jgi:hypothetical protein
MMNNLNSILLEGNLVADPEGFYTERLIIPWSVHFVHPFDRLEGFALNRFS